jgi:peptidoglycan/LPS O-acetylase OafA/YrhL
MAASPQTEPAPHAPSKPAVLQLPPPPIISSATRLPELDGLRGLAILFVLFYHGAAEQHFSSTILSRLTVVGRLGWSGVDLFFVLSGFLIGGILLDVRRSSSYFKTFYLRRAYRILPIYLVLLALFGLRFLHHAAGPLGQFSPSEIPWLSYLTFTQNIWMAVLGTFGVGTLAATWSLAVEEQFYLTAPLVVRKISPDKLALIFISVIAAAPLLRIVFYLSFASGTYASYVAMPCRADALCLGMLSAWLVRTPRWWNVVIAHRPALKIGAGAMFVALVVLTPYGAPLGALMLTFGDSLLALFYTSILLIAVTGASQWMCRVLRTRILMRLGTVSYFTYLFHLSFMEAARRALALRFAYSSDAVQLLGGWLGIGLTLLLAAISWRYFEKPLLRRAHAYRY